MLLFQNPLLHLDLLLHQLLLPIVFNGLPCTPFIGKKIKTVLTTRVCGAGCSKDVLSALRGVLRPSTGAAENQNTCGD